MPHLRLCPPPAPDSSARPLADGVDDTVIMLRPLPPVDRAPREAPPPADPTMVDLPVPPATASLPDLDATARFFSKADDARATASPRVTARVIPARRAAHVLAAVLSTIAIAVALLTALYLHAVDARTRASISPPRPAPTTSVPRAR